MIDVNVVSRLMAAAATRDKRPTLECCTAYVHMRVGALPMCTCVCTHCLCAHKMCTAYVHMRLVLCTRVLAAYYPSLSTAYHPSLSTSNCGIQGSLIVLWQAAVKCMASA